MDLSATLFACVPEAFLSKVTEEETNDPTYEAPGEVEEEIRLANPTGRVGRWTMFQNPDPALKNVYHRGIKKALKQEVWHLAHHYHDGLDGHYLNLPPSKAEFDADVLFTDDEWSDDEDGEVEEDEAANKFSAMQLRGDDIRPLPAPRCGSVSLPQRRNGQSGSELPPVPVPSLDQTNHYLSSSRVKR